MIKNFIYDYPSYQIKIFLACVFERVDSKRQLRECEETILGGVSQV